MGRQKPYNGLYLPTKYIIIRMRPLKALISKSTVHRAHSPFSINGIIPVELKNIRNGNVIKMWNDGEYDIYIVQDVKNLPPYIQKEIYTNDETVFIRYWDMNDIGYSFWDAKNFIQEFPYHRTWDDDKIVRIWDANIDMSILKSKKDFKALYDKICDKIR